MNELIAIDKSFNEGMFISKANNIFVMLHNAVMMDNLDQVRHFISEELEAKYEKIIDELDSKNECQMYDEFNVKNTFIRNVEIRDGYAYINVDIVSRYMDYIVNKDTGKFIRGINTHRVEKMNHLVFCKKIGATYIGNTIKCPYCGADIDVNASGKCSYCQRIFDAENHDWILISIETI